MLCGCAADGTLSLEDTVLGGDWGGAHVGLTLTAEGGTIRYDCAYGILDAPVHRDRAGRFDVEGVHVWEHGGPERADEIPDSIPARYLGQVHGDRMELRVLVGSETLGPFLLRRGAEPWLVRCL